MEFDNEISLQLQAAQELGIPKKFLVDGENIIPKILTLIDTGKTLVQIYEIFDTIFPEDLAILYAKKERRILDMKEVLKNINEFYKFLKLEKIVDVNELNLLIGEWDKKFQRLVEKDRDEYEKILTIQEEMAKYEPLERSPIKVESTIIFAEMQFKNGQIPLSEDGYEIFDLTIPNKSIPFVKWNTNLIDVENRELIKIFKGERSEDMPEFSNILNETNLKETLNTFYLTIAHKETFLKSSYNLQTNTLKLKVPIEEENDKFNLVKKITNVLPLETKRIDEKSIAGEFYIYNSEINLLILSHMIFNDELFRNYFFQKEMANSSVYSTKNTIKIFFRSVQSSEAKEENEPNSSVSFYVSQLFAKGGENVNLKDPKDSKIKKMKLPAGFPYLHVRISSANSIEVAESFINIFTRLLNRYKEEANKIEKLYLSYIPEFLEYKTLDISKTRKDADTKIAKLKQVAPDLFIADYARRCLCQFQPIPIDDEEVDAWKNKTFLHQGKMRERQILAFPPENPRWNFVCPDDKFPFPGVKANKLANKDIYLGLPCCFVKDQIGTAKSNYNKLYSRVLDEGVEDEEIIEDEEDFEIAKIEKGKEEEEEEDEEEREIQSENVIKTDKMVNVDRYGSLPGPISELFKNFYPTVRRRGVPRSVNSLLHCISIAVQDKNYINAKDRERYVSLMRQSVAGMVEPGLLKQELYDFKYEDIASKLKSDEFLDPNLYYRAIEEAYKINLFVFAPTLNEVKRLRNKEESIGSICLPRYKLFSSRSPRLERPTICIYRTLGSESDLLTYPQCELIVGYDKAEVSIFREKVTEMLFSTLNTINKTISWELVQSSEIELAAHDNLYSRINYYNVTLELGKRQYIDEYGKMRGLYLGNDMMVIFSPSQPENLPVDNKVVRADYKRVVKMFGEPVAISLNNDKVDGLWYSILSLAYGIYVPIQEVPQTEFPNLTVGPGNPLGENGKDKVKRIVKLKRDLDFILQVVKWLLILSRLDVNTFFGKYVVIGEKQGDSSLIYDFSKIGRKFPIVENFGEAISEMSKRIPTLFKNNRVFLYSEKMSQGLLYLLRIYMKEYVRDVTPIPKAIKRKYLTEQDFIDYSGVALFLSEKEMKIWLDNMKRNYEIYNTITLNNAVNSDPYIYLAPDKHIYLVQNVMEGDIQRALNVGYYWDKYKVNPGFRSPEYDEQEDLKYLIYSISPANSIIPYENRAGDSLDYISILRYNDFSFACMLRLL